MTDTPRDHLDDDVLSAVLDGEATPYENTHAAACAECSARLSTLREASTLVRTAVAPAPDAQRDAAIAAALAAAVPSNVVPMRSRRRGVPAWLGAAAAAVVAVGAIGLVASSTGGDDDDSAGVASGGAGDDTTSEMAADDAEESLTTLMAAPTDGGDLGAIEDVDLRAAIEGALARQVTGDAAPSEEGEASSGDGTAPTTTASPSAVGPSFAASCEDPVRAGDPELGAVLYRASGTYEGEPAEVLGFEVLREDGGVDRRVYVLAVEGCAIRLAETYSA